MTRIPGASILADWAHARWISGPAFLAAAVSFLIIVPLAASDGGYWPTAWSWATLVFAWVAVVALLFRDALRISMLERLFLVAIGCFASWVGLSLLWTSSTTRTVKVTWSGSDPRLQVLTAGLNSFAVRVRVDGGAWTVISYSTTARSRTFTVRKGHLYEYRVSAKDNRGNRGAAVTTIVDMR